MSHSLWLHGLWPTRLLCPWDFPGKNTGMGCHFLLQGIFLIQGSNLSLLLGRQILYHWATRVPFGLCLIIGWQNISIITYSPKHWNLMKRQVMKWKKTIGLAKKFVHKRFSITPYVTPSLIRCYANELFGQPNIYKPHLW